SSQGSDADDAAAALIRLDKRAAALTDLLDALQRDESVPLSRILLASELAGDAEATDETLETETERLREMRDEAPPDGRRGADAKAPPEIPADAPNPKAPQLPIPVDSLVGKNDVRAADVLLEAGRIEEALRAYAACQGRDAAAEAYRLYRVALCQERL